MAERININEFYAGLDELFKKKRTEERMKYMEDWLAQANAYGDLQGIVAIANELGGLCRAIGQLDRAKTLYETALANLDSLGMKNSENYATTLINFGDVYIFANDNLKALEIFLEAKDILTGLDMAGDYRMAALCNNISMVYRETGEFAKAEEALNIAFNIIKGIPECRSQLGTTYVNLGGLQFRQNKLELALSSYAEACKIYDEDGGTDVHYSVACAGMAQIFCLKGDKETGIKLYEKALQLIDRDFGKTESYRAIEKVLEGVKNS